MAALKTVAGMLDLPWVMFEKLCLHSNKYLVYIAITFAKYFFHYY